MIWVLTIMMAVHGGPPTEFKLDPKMQTWPDLSQCIMAATVIIEDLEDPDKVFSFDCKQEEEL